MMIDHISIIPEILYTIYNTICKPEVVIEYDQKHNTSVILNIPYIHTPE